MGNDLRLQADRAGRLACAVAFLTLLCSAPCEGGAPVPGLPAAPAAPWKTVFPDQTGHTVTGDVRVLDAFPSPQLGCAKRVWVYLPEGYETGKGRYPVLYMWDAQNVFDRKTSYVGEWEVDETLARLQREERATAIVVAVEHGGVNRMVEYLPDTFAPGRGGKGAKTAAFLVETLKPYIDKHFRTIPDREHTGVAGSSMGAIMSFYTLMTYPEAVSKAGAFSFVIPEDFPGILPFARALPPKKLPVRLALHIGTEEAISISSTNREDFVKNLTELAAILKEKGYGPDDVKLDVEEGGKHNEATWAARFGAIFLWLFGGVKP